MTNSPVLMLSYWNPTDYQPSKGIFIHEQVEALCQSNSNIVFLAVNILPGKGLLQKKLSRKELNSNIIITLNIYSFLWKFLYMTPFLGTLWVRNILKKECSGFRPSVVHSNIIFPCAFVGQSIADRFKAKHFISEHWSKAHRMLTHPVFGKRAKQIYQKSNAVICVSRFLAGQIQKETGIQNCIIIPNIVDTRVFHYKEKHFTNETELNLTCVATWKLPKRLDIIIESVLRLADASNKQITLHVVGEGPQKENFKSIKTPANIQINWLGYLSKEKIAAILANTHIFLHASDIETFSIVTAEALVTGTPVLASNAGALPELVDDDCGMIVENNVDAWLTGLKLLTSRSFDYESIARKFENRFSPHAIAGAIENTYKSY